MFIRKATAQDAGALMELYGKHLILFPSSNPPKEPQDRNLWRGKITRFESDPGYNIFVAEADGRVVSSITLIVIENLTRNMRPYAIIENVVTHTDYRGRGYAATLMQKASETAAALNCYKIMLLTSAKEESTLKFYEKCGFNKNDKTGFIKWINFTRA